MSGQRQGVVQRRDLILVLAAALLQSACGAPPDPAVAFSRGDYQTSLAMWQPRAEKGEPMAQNFMGVHYQLGLGVNRDFALAARWYQKAANNGNADAQRNLGAMYYEGQGVPHNNNCAYAWYFVAAQNGNAKAEETRLSMANELTPNKTRIMENWVRAYLRGKPGEITSAGAAGSSEYERVQIDLSPRDMDCSVQLDPAGKQDGSRPGSAAASS